MSEPTRPTVLHLNRQPNLDGGTLVLAFSGWMDGGDVSTGTVRRLVDVLEATPFAEIDADPFYLLHFPGPMEVNALFRPHVKIEEGRVVELDMPANTFYAHEPAKLALFLGKEPHLHWCAFGNALFELARAVGLRRILFVGSFGGSVPHTREPRLYVTASDASLLAELQQFAPRRTGYEGPGSFTSYLLTRAPSVGLEVASLVAEIPGYLQGRNPMSIEAVSRRLAKILKMPLDLRSLRAESTEWELEVSRIVEKDKKLKKVVQELQEAYDDELLQLTCEDGPAKGDPAE
jgi:proteasome assembly chaperone (PAC2) family protein